jgi:hypothetical protein
MKTANLRGLKGLKVRELRQVVYDENHFHTEEDEDPSFLWRQDSRELSTRGVVGENVRRGGERTAQDAVLLCEVDSMDMWVHVTLRVRANT